MTPGQVYAVYRAALREHGYDSAESREAFAHWAAEAGLPADEETRALHTERPFGEYGERPLSEIHPGKARLKEKP